MPDEFPMNDPKKIWQDQHTESNPMSLEEIRRKMQAFETRSRLEALVSIVLAVILSVFFARACAKANDLVLRIGWGVLSLASLYSAWQAHKWIWPRRLAGDAALDP